MQATEEIVVTGFSLITPLGNDIDSIWSKICVGESAAQEFEDLKEMGFRFAKACRIPSFEYDQQDGRGYSMALQCIRSAVEKANIKLPLSTGIFIGSTIGESEAFERAANDPTIDCSKQTVYSWSKKLKKEFGLEGITMAFGSACAAGNYALGTAAEYMRNHHLDVAIAGSAEPFSKIAMAGFSRSRAMTNDVCKPFDKNRNGMILAEGAAFFILERKTSALKRGAKLLASIGKLGLSCDAYHATAPLPDGTGMMQAMKNTMLMEGMKPTEVDWICAHGSGTMASDTAEAKAIAALFGEHKVPVSGFKGAFGHSLGAATAIEAALCIHSIQKNQIAPTTNYTTPDQDISIEVVHQVMEKKVSRVLNCGYAFGGINSALMIRSYFER